MAKSTWLEVEFFDRFNNYSRKWLNTVKDVSFFDPLGLLLCVFALMSSELLEVG